MNKICILLINTLLGFGLPFSAYSAVSIGRLYTMDNAPSGNKVLVFKRLSDGSLQSAGAVATGGNGTGSGLGNQGGLALSMDGNFLFAVNAGSNSISSFKITANSITLIDTKSSGGISPVSLTENDGHLFVLNAGSSSAPGNIHGFYVRPNGKLFPIPYSKRGLSDKTKGTGGAQISYTQDGNQLVVTEKATHLILTYNLQYHVYPSDPVINPSVGNTPFGFAIGKRDRIFVSNAEGGIAGLSSVSSYQVKNDGALRPITGQSETGETAACWVVVTPDERFAYTTNTASGTISSYRIGFNGQIVLANNDAGLTGTGSGPIDMIISPDSRFIYTLNNGNHTISIFKTGIDGSLAFVSALPDIASGANGLVAQ